MRTDSPQRDSYKIDNLTIYFLYIQNELYTHTVRNNKNPF